MVGEEFPKQARLLKAAEFRRVFDRKMSVADRVLIVYGRENDAARPRLGLTVSRKVGRAVLRNRWKRLIREAFRRSQDRLPQDLDLVVIPRPTVDPDYRDIAASLHKLAWSLRKKLRHNRPKPARDPGAND